MDVVTLSIAKADAKRKFAARRTDLYDDTAMRPDGTPSSFQSGQPLTLFGNANLTIANGAFTHTPAAVTNSAGYVQADCGAGADGIYRIGCDVSWPTSDVAALAMVLSEGAWTDTPVSVRSVAKVHAVFYGNVMHVSTFNAPGETKYMDTSAAVSNAAWIPRTKDLRNDATFRPLDIEFDPSTGTIIVVRADGSTVSKTVAALVGFKPRYAIWELYEPSPTAASAKFKNPRASTGSRVGERAATVGDVGRIVSQAPLQTALLPSRRFYRPATTEQLIAPITTAAEVLGTGAVQITRVSVTAPPSGKVVIRVRGYLTNPTARSIFWSIVDTDTGATIDSHRVIDSALDTAGARWIEEAFDFSGLPSGAIKNYALFQVSGGATAADAYISVGQTPSKAFEIEAYPVI